MPPKRKAKKTKMTETFTLQQGINYINSLANAAASKRTWNDSLTTLVHYVEEPTNPHITDMTKAEMSEKYADVNIVPIITDYDNIVDIVENKIKSSRSGELIKVDTQKQYYLCIVRLTQKNSPFQIDKDIYKKYGDKVVEFDKISNQQRALNKPKGGNAKHPDFDWITAIKEFDEFLAKTPFTKTATGLKSLRTACMVGLYIFNRPRRVQDFSSLQYFSKKPTEKEATDRNIIYKDVDKLVFSIDKFKTRFLVKGNAEEPKEVLPTFVKELDNRLASLFKDYIKKAEVKDMSKLSALEKRQGVNYYVFVKEGGNPTDGYDDNTFSKVLSSAFKKVFKRDGLNVNAFRHIYQTFVANNLNHYNDKQLGEIAKEVGDTARVMPQNLRYRIQHPENQDMDKSLIEGNIQENEFIREMIERQAEAEGSVGHVEEPTNKNDIEEIQSRSHAYGSPVNDESLDSLYMQLGKAVYEVEKIKMLINKRLNVNM